jgi:hypothetical protein
VIVFDLRCAHAHVFEAWFTSSDAYEDQRSRRLLACPLCGDADVIKAVMAPNVTSKGSARMPPPKDSPTPEAVKSALHALAAAQAKALEKSEWVGRSFAGRARAMHVGEADPAPIHGEATIAEARALADEGVAIAALPLPVVPPESLN